MILPEDKLPVFQIKEYLNTSILISFISFLIQLI